MVSKYHPLMMKHAKGITKTRPPASPARGRRLSGAPREWR